MDGWLFPDQRPFWDKTKPEMPYADCNWAPNESKEDTMKTIPAAFGTEVKPVNEPKKETAMPKTTKKETKMNESKPATKKTRMTVAEVKARFESGVAEVRKLYNDAQPIDKPYNPAKDNGVLNRDPEWNEQVRYIAADLGWTDNRFLYKSYIEANGGKLKKGAYGVPSFFGKGFTPVYNIADVEWPDGKIPTEWAKAQRKPRKSGFKPVTLNIPGGGTMTVHSKAELRDYQKLVAMMA